MVINCIALQRPSGVFIVPAEGGREQEGPESGFIGGFYWWSICVGVHVRAHATYVNNMPFVSL